MEDTHRHNLTSEASHAPLPAPTTVTSRSLQPRRDSNRSSRSGSRSTTASRSQSRSSPILPLRTVSEADLLVSTPLATSESGGNVRMEDVSAPVIYRVHRRIEDGDDNGAPTKRRRVDVNGARNFESSLNAGSSSSNVLAYDSVTHVDHDVQGDQPLDALPGQDEMRGGAVEENWPTPDDLVDPSAVQPELPQGEHVLTASDMDGTTPQEQETLLTAAHSPSSGAVSQGHSDPINVDSVSEIFSIAEPSSLSPVVVGNRRRSIETYDSMPMSLGFPAGQHAAITEPAVSVDEPLSAYTCPVCFSPPTHATLTPCGHICCGECLFTAVKTTMQRALHSVPVSERCPVCRAPIPGWDGRGGGVIGLKPKMVFSL